MIDLTSRRINSHLLQQKFAPVLDLIKYKETHIQLSYIFDVAVDYIKGNYSDIERDWKVWCTIAIKDIFLSDSLKINNEKDIENIIDAFMLNYKKNYSGYINNTTMFVNEYFRDYPFVLRFIKTKL